MVNGTPCVRLCVVEQRSHGRVSLVSLQILEESRLGTAQLIAHADRAELAAAAEHNDEGVVQQLAKMIPTFTPTRQNLKL